MDIKELVADAFGVEVDAVTPEMEKRYRQIIDGAKALEPEPTPEPETTKTDDELAALKAELKAEVEAAKAMREKQERAAMPKPKLAPEDVAPAQTRAAVTRPQFALSAEVLTHEAKRATGDPEMQHRVKDWQQFNDEMVYLCAILEARDGRPVDPRSTNHWKRYVGSRGDWGKFVDEYKGFGVEPEFAKATFTTTTGADYLPTILSSNLIPRAEYEMGVANAVRQIDMPSKVYDIPGVGSAVSVYKTAEAATPTQSDTDDRKVTFTAIDVKGRSMYTDDLAEDSIIAILPRVMEEHDLALAKALEFAVIHGDTDDTQGQSSNTTQDGYLAYNFWDGIYAHAIASSTVTSASGARFTGDMALNALADLGKYLNGDTVWTAHPIQVSYFRTMRDNATDKNLVFVPGGANASWTDRPLLELLGYPVIPSGGNSITNGTTGYYTGTTVDRTQVIAFNRNYFALGNRRRRTVETDKTIATGVIEVVTTWRGDFQCLGGVTDTCSAAYYDVDYDA